MKAAKAVWRLLAAAAVLAIALAGFTYWALESGGVAVVVTRQPDGALRETHVWYVLQGGDFLVEAGTPENGWFEDVQRDPQVVLQREETSAPYVAEPLPNPDGHTRIRTLLREKYGLRDAWIALLFDTSRSVAVRLRPRLPGE